MTGIEIRNLVKKETRNSYDRFYIKKEYTRKGRILDIVTIDVTDSFIDFIIQKYQEKIIENLIKGEEIKISNFMTFYIKTSNREVFINPKTGEKILREGKKHIKIRECKNLLHSLNIKDSKK